MLLLLYPAPSLSNLHPMRNKQLAKAVVVYYICMTVIINASHVH